MAQCPHCKSPLSCGCQQRKASNGQTCCNNCIHTYEATIKGNKSNNQKKWIIDSQGKLVSVP